MEQKQTIQTQTQTNADNSDYLIQTKIIRENGDIKLYVKTCEEFEKYLKNTREITTNTNFCNTGLTKDFYNNRLDGLTQTNVYLDSAIRDLIIDNHLNFCILRLKNISKGITININKLITKNDLNSILRNFIKEFREFYKDFIQDYEINCILTYKNIIL